MLRRNLNLLNCLHDKALYYPDKNECSFSSQIIIRFLFSRISKPVTNRLFSLELAILGCNVSTDSMEAVRHVFREIGPKLNLATYPPVENFKPLKVKKYLKENHLKFCVLVVDATTVKDAYDNLGERKLEYEGLLTTAAHEVGKFDFLSPNERERVFPHLIPLDGLGGGYASTTIWSIRKVFACYMWRSFSPF